MKGFRVAILCVFGFVSGAAAQQNSAPPAPATTEAHKSSALPTTQNPPAADYSQEPIVIEQYFTKVRFENDGTGERDLSVRVRVQSDTGVRQLGELVFGYNSADEQMDVRTMRVHKADGSVVNAGLDAVKEMTGEVERDAPEYTDYKEKHITVPSLHSGDTIQYEIVTRIVKPLAPNQFWFEQNFLEDAIALDEQLEVSIPQGRGLIVNSPEYSNVTGEEIRKVKLLPHGGGVDDENSPFSKYDANGRTIYRWKHANLSRKPADNAAKKASPPPAKTPDVQLTTFRSWDEVAAWYANLERGRAEPSPEIRAKTQQLIQGHATELDKMQALYSYVAQNIRYVSLSFGLGRYQPHSAAEVFRNQYGDCKDKHTLLAAMLAAADLPSDAVLIPLARALDTSVPSPAQFDHMITSVPLGNDLIWMDSTSEVAPFRLLTPRLRDKSALLVRPDGNGKIVETPIDPPFLSTQRVEITAQVSDLGKLTSQLRYFLRGDNEFALRVAFHRTPQTEWKELGQTIAALDGIKGVITSVKPSDPLDTAKPFELDLEFSQLNYLDWSSKTSKIGVPLLAIGLPDAAPDSNGPIHLGSPLDVTMNLKLTLPSNDVAHPPVAISVDRDYAEFKSAYHFADHVLTAERTLNFKMRDLPASRMSDYLAFIHAVESDETQILIVDKSAGSAPTIPTTATSAELLEAGLAALNSGNPRQAIPLLERANQLDPKSMQGWNDLGLAHLRLGEFNDAVTAFRKQVEVNPYDDQVYDYLGLTLQQLQKSDEATAVFRKQLELNPLDPIAHAALGALFLEQHKYAEAVPELDKATVLAPGNAELQVTLGRAFLNSGQKDKGLEAFEKGIELAQTPVVWNNVAYNLAQHNIELDKATQYAESAVSTTAASLRNTELAHLSLTDLGLVSSIGDYWDTLGLVYFEKGELDKAERFFRASWLLNQHGEVADHLGQVYEKRGDKDRAALLYAEAMIAAHAVPETRQRLVALSGENAKLDNLEAEAKVRLVKARTFPAGKVLNENAQAEFYVLLSPGLKNPKVDSVKFVSGSQDLRPIVDKLRALEFGPMFPDASPAKLVRRGTLTCSAATGNCTFTLILPDDVRTLN